MQKEIRKTIRLSEDEYQQMNELMNELDFVENFSQLIIYIFHYFVKNRNTEEYNRKILQDISRKLDLNKELLLKYMKIIAKSQIETQLNYLKDLERREKALEEIYYGVDELERSNQIIKEGRLNEKRN
ncbi:hypothetical protein HMPREF3187_01215 [Aerococcus christensenii]|uniref:Uncharacterized protein n=1 Tax=Aerococcus christensenii TaxID=87541 RepID=A0A133XVU1_9LACT|nr:hypothetical protein [Aerococcus christensenii]KXB35051.1 hypothetical protein HMPREF3187_01215 [Aerococcus christensenii]